MRYQMRIGLKALGLTAIGALTAMALMASAAQATVWHVGGTTLSAGVEKPIEGSTEETGFLEVLELGLKITCKEAYISGSAVIYNEGGVGKGHGTVNFKGNCVITDSEGNPSGCTIEEETISAKVFAQLEEEESKTLVRLTPYEPTESELFTTVHVIKGEGCLLPKNSKVKGSVKALVSTESNTEFAESTNLLLKPIQSALATLTFGAHESHFREATAEGNLTSNETWGAF